MPDLASLTDATIPQQDTGLPVEQPYRGPNLGPIQGATDGTIGNTDVVVPAAAPPAVIQALPRPEPMPVIPADPQDFSPDTTVVGSKLDKIINRLTGANGEQRYQLWPEKVVREGLSAAHDAMTEGLTLPGLRREDYTDIPAPDMPTNDSTWLGRALNVAPVAASPADTAIGQAQSIAALAGTGGLAGASDVAAGDAALGSTPFLRPALKFDDKIYKAPVGGQHLDALPAHLAQDFQTKALSGADINDYQFGFMNHKGQFLDREKALDYAVKEGLVDPSAGRYGALTSTLLADSSKPGTAIEAMAKTGKITNFKGEKIDAPRVFYRGTNLGDTRRIKTGADTWDGHLFAADNPESARLYGNNIDRYEASPDAKILYEGTKDFIKLAGKWGNGENLLQYADRAAKAAKSAGYDALWFKRQGDVGTAIFNPDKFTLRSDNQAGLGLAAVKEPLYPLAKLSDRWTNTLGQNDTSMQNMTPDEFLNQSRSLKIDEESRENIDSLKQHIQEGKPLDPLELHANGKEDGRHRAIAAKELGIKQVPVINFRPKFDFAPGESSGSRSVKLGPTEITYGVNPKNNDVELSLLRTDKGQRGQRNGRAAMEQFLKEADASNKRVLLNADPMDKSTSKAKLESFYKSLGFVRNAGNKRDFSTRAEYVRDPKPKYIFKPVDHNPFEVKEKK